MIFGAFRFRPALSLAVAPALLILLGLSAWQIQRLGWKAELIADAQRGLAQEPQIYVGSSSAQSEPDPLKPYIVKGELFPEKSVDLYGHRVMGVTGAHRVSLLVLDDGTRVALNRGWVPQKWQGDAKTSQHIEARVILRKVEGSRGFDPANANVPERGIWIYGVPEQLAREWEVDALLPQVAYVLRDNAEGYSPHSQSFPLGHLPRVNLPNNHLGYAMTWFGLAVGLFGIYLILSLRRNQEGSKPEEG